MDKNWRIWDSAHQYGNYFKQRADGTLDEMESSKSICDIINNHYAKKMTVADIGCGCGHYLRSLIKRVDGSSLFRVGMQDKPERCLSPDFPK